VLFRPGTGVIVLVWGLILWFAIAGVNDLVAAASTREHRGWNIAMGIISIVAALILLFSPATALGVLWAMRAVATRLWGEPSLSGRHVAISGVGKVGAALADHLHAEGARLTIADVRAAATTAVSSRTGATVVSAADIHRVPCDLFSPCALGATLDATTIPELACAGVVGCANNQLATDDDALRIQRAGVLYAPDYVVNAGGVINIAEEQHGYDRSRAEARIAKIYDTTLEILDLADAEGIPTALAADRFAEQRIEAARVTARASREG
jgi:glutamate dehydrogenase/leucine dehydrogenase